MQDFDFTKKSNQFRQKKFMHLCYRGCDCILYIPSSYGIEF